MIEVYEPSVETDVLVAQWWDQLRECGDLDHVFSLGARPLSGFFLAFQPPTVLFFERDPQLGIVRALWLMLLMNTVAMGLWAHPKRRSEPAGVTFVETVLRQTLAAVPVVVAVINRPQVRDLATRFGFTSVGTVPLIYNGADGELFYLTREQFEERYGA